MLLLVRNAVSLGMTVVRVVMSDNGLANSLLHDGRGNLSSIMGILASI